MFNICKINRIREIRNENKRRRTVNRTIRKTIRYYESEGLISVKINSNSYQEYDEDNINKLQKQKFLES